MMAGEWEEEREARRMEIRGPRRGKGKIVSGQSGGDTMRLQQGANSGINKLQDYTQASCCLEFLGNRVSNNL